jgi:hypothetical protein
MSQKFYDPNLFTFTFSLIPFSGWIEDTMIEIETDGPAFTYKKGLDGDFSRSKVVNQTALITAHLMSTSRTNAALSLIHAQDKAQDGGAGVAPVAMKDGNGTSVFAHDAAYIEDMPKSAYGKEADDRAWKIRVCPGFLWLEGGT